MKTLIQFLIGLIMLSLVIDLAVLAGPVLLPLGLLLMGVRMMKK
jgi:hypothetical protein